MTYTVREYQNRFIVVLCHLKLILFYSLPSMSCCIWVLLCFVVFYFRLSCMLRFFSFFVIFSLAFAVPSFFSSLPRVSYLFYKKERNILYSSMGIRTSLIQFAIIIASKNPNQMAKVTKSHKILECALHIVQSTITLGPFAQICIVNFRFALLNCYWSDSRTKIYTNLIE